MQSQWFLMMMMLNHLAAIKLEMAGSTSFTDVGIVSGKKDY